MLRDNAADSSIRNHSVLTVVFTGPPSDIGFQENLCSAAPVQLLSGKASNKTNPNLYLSVPSNETGNDPLIILVFQG
jgi:hypothetical protein